jgi:hypothetical protein
LFTVRQVLKLSPQDLKQIRDQLPNKTSDEKERRKKFDISEIEREMLMELKDLLQMFEFVTDELQSNRINISRVYPCIEYLRENLINHEKIKSGEVKYKYTEQMRLDLLTSLNKRFSHLIDQDVFIASTFLDPLFGLDVFQDEKKIVVKSRVVSLMKQQEAVCRVLESIDSSNLNNTERDKNKSSKALEERRTQNYIFHRKSTNSNIDKSNKVLEDELNDYIRVISDVNFECTCTLSFWKVNETRFKLLSTLAKKYLGVPASSAAVERMFSISGHVFNSKRRRMGVTLFAMLVFLKLNENLLLLN